MDALHNLSLLQLCFGDSADTICAEIRVSRLDAAQAAQILIARFLPFGDKVGIGYSFFQAILVQLSRNDFAAHKHIIDVARFLMMDFEDGPQRLVDSFSFMRFCFSYK